MKRKLVLGCVAAAVLLSLLACASAPSQVSVDASYAGKEVEVAAGGSLTVTLESNPTTGFEWELASNTDEAVLELVGSKYEAPEGAVPGAGGKEVWTFKALKKGNSTISMEYSRSWEEGVETAETFVLTVVVK